jgi:hypothetical protein
MLNTVKGLTMWIEGVHVWSMKSVIEILGSLKEKET